MWGYYLQVPESAPVVPRSDARDRLCLVGEAGTVFPPFAGSGVLRAVASAGFVVTLPGV
jgi:2-polyprenyl-6-methoxyphenol hydroxylase-like FAD-dependent oxidoreductase